MNTVQKFKTIEEMKAPQPRVNTGEASLKMHQELEKVLREIYALRLATEKKRK